MTTAEVLIMHRKHDLRKPVKLNTVFTVAQNTKAFLTTKRLNFVNQSCLFVSHVSSNDQKKRQYDERNSLIDLVSNVKCTNLKCQGAIKVRA